MKSFNGLLWVTVISGLATGWLAMVFVVQKWSADPGAAALGLVAGAFAFGLLARALFAALRP